MRSGHFWCSFEEKAEGEAIKNRLKPSRENVLVRPLVLPHLKGFEWLMWHAKVIRENR